MFRVHANTCKRQLFSCKFLGKCLYDKFVQCSKAAEHTTMLSRSFAAQCGPKTKIAIKLMPAFAKPKLSYDQKNMRLGRELAPHLKIYKKQLTSALSILIRISGCILCVGVWIIGLSGLLCDCSLNAVAKEMEQCELAAKLLNVGKVLLALPLAYHLVGGTRHLIWYFNVFLSKPQIYATGYLAIVLTFVLAAAIATLDFGSDEAAKLKEPEPEPAKKK
ncbi:SdhC [Drosophila busckii]|uniref:SdhC n=1 Tax=Drosophila busckii TaxID=30019 RepID=A0A0M4EGU8_DROBS|nr:succinate dehydrogenase cytochrome b560 subunit, mitochondrial [Drosophila busckii]ALC45421.1 SdhC [Drosophila busckii]